MSIKSLGKRVEVIEEERKPSHLGYIHLATMGDGRYYKRPLPTNRGWSMFYTPEQAESEGWQLYTERQVKELEAQGWNVMVHIYGTEESIEELRRKGWQIVTIKRPTTQIPHTRT